MPAAPQKPLILLIGTNDAQISRHRQELEIYLNGKAEISEVAGSQENIFQRTQNALSDLVTEGRTPTLLVIHSPPTNEEFASPATSILHALRKGTLLRQEVKDHAEAVNIRQIPAAFVTASSMPPMLISKENTLFVPNFCIPQLNNPPAHAQSRKIIEDFRTFLNETLDKPRGRGIG